MSAPQLVHDQPVKGVLLLCVAVFLFASVDALAKYLSAFYPIAMIVWARYAVHTLLMVLVFVPRHQMAVVRTRQPLLQLVRALSLLAVSLLFTTGLLYMPLAEQTSVLFITPILVTLYSALFLAERVRGGQWLAVAAGFIGVLIIVRPGGALFSPAALLPLAAAACFGCYQLLTRKLGETDSPVTTNFLTGLINSLVMTAGLALFWRQLDFSHVPLMLALGTCGMLGHLLLTHSFRYATPAVLGPISYAQIVFAGLLGALFFAHTPDAWALLGMLVIAASGLTIALGQRA
ncbi:DMT family transporter [Pseudomonas benzenivorans]|uniref:DMT family transporter n=1 Tax=Pseudomonas benzenivorans TaxID=556533 RepID=UPI00210328E8|nr:DMT family transporter [Pseudomonas benzenivorans]